MTKEEGTEFKIYRDAINKPGNDILEYLKENIIVSPDETIRIKTEDIRNALGPEFKNKSDTAIFNGIRYALYYEHPFKQKEAIIGVRTGKHKDGSNMLIFYFAYYPELPKSLINK